jgi:hypothetical protein
MKSQRPQDLLSHVFSVVLARNSLDHYRQEVVMLRRYVRIKGELGNKVEDLLCCGTDWLRLEQAKDEEL